MARRSGSDALPLQQRWSDCWPSRAAILVTPSPGVFHGEMRFGGEASWLPAANVRRAWDCPLKQGQADHPALPSKCLGSETKPVLRSENRSSFPIPFAEFPISSRMDWPSLAGAGQSSTGFEGLPSPSYCAVYWNEWPIRPSRFPETKAFQQCKMRADRLFGYSTSQMILEPFQWPPCS
jgi:hypothetical protein